MQLHKLEYFHALARTGSFVRAANQLNISQPALSRSIQSLEGELGVTLFHRARGRGGITLTTDGARLLEHAVDLLARVETMEQDFSKTGRRTQRELAFGLGPMLASQVLPRVLPGIVADHPALRIAAVVNSSREALGRMVEGQLEFYVGYAVTRSVPARVRRREFSTIGPRALVRQGHPLADTPQVRAEDLGAYPIVSGTAWNDRLADEPGEIRDLFSAVVQIDNLDVLCDLVLNSDSILVSGIDPPDPGLVALRTDHEFGPGISRIYVYSIDGVRLSPLAERVLREMHAIMTAARAAPG